MFRTLAIAAALVASPALADETKPFDMYQLNTSQTYSGEMMVGGKKCTLKGTGEETCSRFGGAQIGTVIIMGLNTRFADGKLYAIGGSTLINYASELKAAFVAKYGEPSIVEHPTWQNQMGATFDNEVNTWVFVDGVLVLKARGDNRDTTEFLFTSKKNVPARLQPQGQPVNF